MSDKTIAIYEPTLDQWNTIRAIAPVAEAARMFGITKDQAAITMLAAHELGFGWSQALNGLLYVIDTPKGKKVCLSGAAANALIQRSGVLAEMQVTDHIDKSGNPIGCTVRMKRKDTGFEYAGSFMLADAQRAGLIDKTNWKTYPTDMYFHRALMRTGRRICSDVLAGMYVADELGAVTNEDGEPVDAPSWHVVEEPKSQPNPQPAKMEAQPEPAKASEAKEPEPVKEPEPTEEPEKPANDIPDNLTVADLLNRDYSVTDLQAAIQALQAEGKEVHFPPATSEECKLVLEKLEAKNG